MAYRYDFDTGERIEEPDQYAPTYKYDFDTGEKVKTPGKSDDRPLWSRANDFMIDTANAAVNLAKSGVDLVAPGSGAALSIDQFIKGGQEDQSDYRQSLRRQQQELIAEAKARGDTGILEWLDTSLSNPVTVLLPESLGNLLPFVATGGLAGPANALRATTTLGAAVGGGEVRGSKYSNVIAATEDRLRAESPEYVALREGGLDHESARAELAKGLSPRDIPAIAAGGAVGLISGRVGAEGALFGKGGQSMKRTVATEMGSEAVEGGVQQASGNFATQGVLPSQSLTEDVGLSAVQESVTAGPAAVVAGAAAKPSPKPTLDPNEIFSEIGKAQTVDEAIASAARLTYNDPASWEVVDDKLLPPPAGGGAEGGGSGGIPQLGYSPQQAPIQVDSQGNAAPVPPVVQQERQMEALRERVAAERQAAEAESLGLTPDIVRAQRGVDGTSIQGPLDGAVGANDSQRAADPGMGVGAGAVVGRAAVEPGRADGGGAVSQNVAPSEIIATPQGVANAADTSAQVVKDQAQGRGVEVAGTQEPEAVLPGRAGSLREDRGANGSVGDEQQPARADVVGQDEASTDAVDGWRSIGLVASTAKAKEASDALTPGTRVRTTSGKLTKEGTVLASIKAPGQVKVQWDGDKAKGITSTQSVWGLDYQKVTKSGEVIGHDGLTESDRKARTIDAAADELSLTIRQEASEKDFSAKEMPAGIRYWSADTGIDEATLKDAVLKRLRKPGAMSKGRLAQIEKALADAQETPRAAKVKEALESTFSPPNTPQSASEWASEMARLRTVKPRPLDKLYGKNGPTPEQAEFHAASTKAWNSAYRKATVAQKSALNRDNAAEKNDPKFSRADEKTADKPEPPKATIADRVSRVTAHADSIRKDWKGSPEVVILKSFDDAPAEVRDTDARSEAEGAPEGFYHDGKVYLVADKIKSAKDVRRVLFHESLGHAGMRKRFGATLDSVLDQVSLARPNEVRAKAAEYKYDLANPKQRRAAAEEVLAQMAQDKPDSSIVKRAIAAIRKFLKSIGFEMQMSDNDILHDILLPARKSIEKGKPDGVDSGGTGFSRKLETSGIFPSLRRLKGNATASRAKTDAVYILGFDPGIPVEEGTLRPGVPMAYNVDDRVIVYDKDQTRSRAADAQYMLEELLHAIDHIGGLKTISASTRTFLPGGDVRTEIDAAMRDSSALRDFLGYPLAVDWLSETQESAELFARIGVFFKADPATLQRVAPKTYEKYRSILGGKEITEGVPGEVRGSPASSTSEVGGQSGDARADAGPDAGRAGVGREARLGRLRADIARAFGGNRDGADVTFNRPPAFSRNEQSATSAATPAARDADAVRARAASAARENGRRKSQRGVQAPRGLDPKFSRQTNTESSPVWFSALNTEIGKINARAMPVAGWKQQIEALKKRGVIKGDEVEWTGLGEWIDLQQGRVTKEDVQQFLAGNGVKVSETMLGGEGRPQYPHTTPDEWQGAIDAAEARDDWDEAARLTEAWEANEGAPPGGGTKYDKYQLPGGKNYRELLLTLPRREVTTGDVAMRLFNKPMANLSESERDDVVAEMRKQPTGASDFRSGHWDQPNILAHIRFNERTDTDGKRVLFIEEIQSDWAQQGKKEGFDNDAAFQRLIAARDTAPDAQREELQRQIDEMGMNASKGVPSAPFVGKTDAWVGLSIKRMIRYAAENGFDKVAFVNGEQSADRYDLSKQVEYIDYVQEKPDEFRLAVVGKDGQGINLPKETFSGAELENYVGKDVAQRIVNGEGESGGGRMTLRGPDLKVGGEGMKAFYNQIVPKVVKDVLKKLGGGGLSQSTIVTDKDGWHITPPGQTTHGKWMVKSSDYNSKGLRFDTEQEAKNALAEKRQTSRQTSIDITPAMRDTAMQGMPMFSRKKQTETAEFQNWFKGSKVVDENGDPLVVYHGTESSFSAFDKSKAGQKDSGWYGAGFYMTADPETASAYSVYNEMKDGSPTAGANVMPLFVSLKNPYIWPDNRQAAKTVAEAQAITRELIAAGYDGVVAPNKYQSPEYADFHEVIAFEPTQIKSATGNNGDFSPTNPDIRFSRDRSAWEATPPSKMDDFIRTLQDKNIDLKRVIESIKKTVGDIADKWNPYLQEELYHGRTATQTKEFLSKEIQPLLQEMKARGVGLEDLGKYLHARHAPERNAQMAKINPNDPDMQDGGSGMTNKEAKEYMASLSPEQKRAYDALSKKVDEINKGTTDLLVSSGLEKQETIDAWNAAYKSYVPLMRDDVADSGFGTGQGFSVKGSASKRAMGSKKDVIDILANVAMQRERAIVRSEKNKVAQALWGLAALHPNPDFWIAVDPKTDPTDIEANLVRMGLNPLDAASIAKEPQQRYVDPRTGLVSWRVNPLLRSAPNVVSMRVNGDEKFVVMNEGDERAMRMGAAIKNLDADQLGRVLSISAKISRYFSAINTQWNPLFAPVNFIRDVQSSLLNLSTTPIAGKQAEVMKHTLAALKGIYIDLRDQRAGKEGTSAWAELFQEFQKEGGQTGYRDMFANSADRAKALESEFRKLTEGKAKHVGRAVFEWLSDYNDAGENAVRLAVYKVGKDNGMTKQQAASIAKSISVNFNRKGTVATQAGALYAFFNASAQGSARMLETLAGPAGKKIIYGGLILGSMQALALAAAGFKDDEPPEFIRERNIIIPIGDGKYITIPMPLGLHVIPNLARIPTEFALSGFKKPADRIVSLFGVFTDAFNPIGNAGMSIQTIAPTAIDPLVALSENKDFAGRPIARQDFSSLHPTPGHTRARDTASAISRGVSYGLNWLSGGTDYKPGALSPSPDQIDYLIGQVTGGVGREALKTMQTATAIKTGEELPPYKIPLVGRFYGDTTGQSAQASRYYDNLKEIFDHKSEIDGRRKHGEPIADYIRDNPESRLIKQADKTQSEISKLKTRKRQMMAKDATPAEIKMIESQITLRMRQLNERVELLEAQ